MAKKDGNEPVIKDKDKKKAKEKIKQLIKEEEDALGGENLKIPHNYIYILIKRSPNPENVEL